MLITLIHYLFTESKSFNSLSSEPFLHGHFSKYFLITRSFSSHQGFYEVSSNKEVFQCLNIFHLSKKSQKSRKNQNVLKEKEKEHTSEQCEEILPGQKIFSFFDNSESRRCIQLKPSRQDGNGKLDYDEFVKMMLQY